jgi:type IV pilus assembly protein PilW
MITMHMSSPRRPGLSDAASMRRRSGPRRRFATRGLTLVELLVAMGLGLVIITALVTLYANVTRSNQEMAKTNLLIENGRFAMQLLQEDVQLAGFWGPLDPLEATAIPNPCLAYASWGTGAARATYVNNLLAIAVQGYSDGSPYATCGGALANVVARSDVLFVRHASTCAVGAGCEGVGDTGPHIQVSGCRTDPSEPAYVVETTADMDARNPRIRRKGCGGNANEVERRRLVSHIYFVANNPAGVPTLMRMSYQNGAFGEAQPLVEGIEAFKVEYGVDELGTNGLPISATNPPDGNTDRYQSCNAATPCTLAVLANAVTVKLHILARNLEPTVGYTDSKAYTVGPLAIAAANDRFKRHVFTTTVRLVNPSSRREIP